MCKLRLGDDKAHSSPIYTPTHIIFLCELFAQRFHGDVRNVIVHGNRKPPSKTGQRVCV